jgi:hypothetical protein
MIRGRGRGEFMGRGMTSGWGGWEKVMRREGVRVGKE